MQKPTVRLTTIAMFVIGLIPPAVWAQNLVQTIAGGGPNNLPALVSSLGSPASVALDGAGNIYVADLYSDRVLRLATTGNVSVVAGNGARGRISSGDGGPAVSAKLVYPSGAAADKFGNVFIADRTACTIREVSAQNGNISTVAGTGSCAYSGDGGPATNAKLNNPSGVAVDRIGNVFIADTNNCLVRAVSAATGVISTVAGTQPDSTGLLHCGYSGDGGLATGAKVGFPNGVALDGLGNVYIADTTNCTIREISVSTGFIATVAGTGSCGYSGDAGLATGAQLSQPYGVAVDGAGNVLIADTTNCLIREISASSSQISTVAGDYSLGCGYSGDGSPATSARLNQPYGVAVDSSGDILIADYLNAVIREVSASTGNISTFAGVALSDPNHAGQMIGLAALSGDGHPATDAELSFLNDSPYGAGLAVDRFGNVFIADTANNAVREVDASTGIITTIAGNGLIGYAGDGGPATSAQLFYPRDVAVDGPGNVFIMDSGNCVIRKISASTGIISTVAGTLPDSSGSYHCGFSGDGGPATSAELYPVDLFIPAGGVAVDSSGNLFIADTGNSVIRKVSASTGVITTVAGIPNSIVAVGGDGSPATNATLFSPYGVAVDSSGNIFIADTYDFTIREVTAVDGNIYTVAGNKVLAKGFSGDGGPAGSAQIGTVFGVFLDSAGNLFIPDPDNCVIRQISGATGIISTVAGTPNSNGDYYCGYAGDGGPALSAVFDYPSAAGADISGDLVVLDNFRVRSVAGLVQGPAASAVPFPNPLAFPSGPLGTSNTLTVILSNRGSLATTVSTVAISGTNASDFSETDTCAGHSLAEGGGSCTINVKLTPSVSGAESALLTITDTAGTQTVIVTGTGTAAGAPGFSPSVPAISFGKQQETSKSTAMSVTVTNTGNASLMISGLQVSGSNAGDFAISVDTCSGVIVPMSGTCSVSATFTPSTTGTEIASLQFADNAAGSPQSVGLNGTGTDFSISLAPGGSSTATVQAGGAVTYNLQVTPISGFNGTVTISCAGAPSQATCIPSESSAAPNGDTAATFSVRVTTMAPSTATPGIGRQGHPFDDLRTLPTVLMVALGLALLSFSSRFRSIAAQLRNAYPFALPLGFILLATLLFGCGGGGTGGPPILPPPSGGTPIGKYSLMVTGTSNGLSRSQTLTLTVN